MSINTRMAVTIGTIFILAGLITIVFVNWRMKEHALTEAEEKAMLLLDSRLSVHTYFTHQLKPVLFQTFDEAALEHDFEPVWMSSTYAIREMEKYFSSLHDEPYYYKEAAINARHPENEADPFEREFLERINQDPDLMVRANIRVFDKEPFFTVLRRGEAMEANCLRCHSTPELSPPGLVDFYGDERSFERSLGEVISAISIRIPLGQAYASANRLSMNLGLAMGAILLALFSAVIFLNRRWVFDPLEVIREKTRTIATDPRHLGEQVVPPRGRELSDLASNFNIMSASLLGERNLLEERVARRTNELSEANQNLRLEMAERSRVEQALRESEFRFKALHNASFGGIVIHDKGIILECNQGLSDITGYTYEELIGMDGLLLIAEKSREAVMNNIMSGYEKPYEALGLRKNGREYPVRLEARNIPYKDKNVEVVEFRDITEQKQAEQERLKLQAELFQARKMESVGTLAGGIAHDFNNLLHVMGGNLELLDKKLSKDHPGKKRVGTIQKSMDRAAQLVRQMLLFSRKAETSRQDLDLNQEIDHGVKLLERTIPRMVKIEFLPDKDLWQVKADPIQVEQVLLNLGTNAADAMPDGGSLVIKTANTDVDPDAGNDLAPGRYVLMTVTDTGTGMDQDTLEHVFDPFYTTKEVGKGTGLGLASVYGIVKGHGGHITCESEPGQGTKFMIYWPVAMS
jgi:PAS domain S-box-containing protein